MKLIRLSGGELGQAGVVAVDLALGLVIPGDPVGEDRNQVALLLHCIEVVEQIIEQQRIVVGEIDHEFALRLPERVEPVGDRAAVFRHLEGADQRIARGMRCHHL
jgi:hypothetical protein